QPDRPEGLDFWCRSNHRRVVRYFFFSSRRRHTRWPRDWSSDVCSSDLLPPVPPAPEGEVEKRFPGVRVFVHEIQVIGSTVFSDEELAKATAPFQGRVITSQDLERLRLALTLLYVNKGYITSGAIIPDQDVTFGVITVQIVEWKLTSIEI